MDTLKQNSEHLKVQSSNTFQVDWNPLDTNDKVARAGAVYHRASPTDFMLVRSPFKLEGPAGIWASAASGRQEGSRARPNTSLNECQDSLRIWI